MSNKKYKSPTLVLRKKKNIVKGARQGWSTPDPVMFPHRNLIHRKNIVKGTNVDMFKDKYPDKK
tara:strand:- start:7115 stop:7306 length:192 start_codon:yes stop_codon:yes gene_type:complete